MPTAEGLQLSFAAFLNELQTAKARKQVLPDVTTKSAETLIAKTQLHSEELVIGAVLGPNPNGNCDRLLATFSNLRNSGRAARLMIFAGPDARLASRTASRELDAHLEWVSDESTTREMLQKCDVLVSLQDGVPLLVLQAMSSRIPIITSAVRVPEALRNQRSVLFIHPGGDRGETNGLQEALLLLSQQPKRQLGGGFRPGETIARQYSDTYLWRENSLPSANGHASKGRALIKKALFGVVPERQLLKHGNRNRAQIAITIDDGPDPVYTPRILDIFREHAVKATFFVVGGAAEQYPEIVLRMKKEGHEVGSHSYSHPYFNQLTWAGANREIRMTQWVLDRILGEECKLFRPPHGKLSLRALIPAWAAGQQVVLWNVDLKDYRASEGEVEAQAARTLLSSGDIILYHGINEPALKALPYVIKAARDKDREAVTISELMG